MDYRAIVRQVRDKTELAYAQTVERAYFRLFGHQINQRFAIVGNARTGSNYLLDGLKSSPSIRMYHEIFSSQYRQVGKDFDKTLSTVYQYEGKAIKLVGFKVFYNHLTHEEWQKFVSCQDMKIIHLTRQNRLRTVISLEIAFKTGQWTKSGKSSDTKEKRVELEPSKLIRRIEQIEQGEADTRQRFRDRQILEIVYEELVQSPDKVFSSVGRYLGVDGIDPDKIRIKRQNPESLEQLIVNYDEVVSVLRNTRFAEYLSS